MSYALVDGDALIPFTRLLDIDDYRWFAHGAPTELDQDLTRWAAAPTAAALLLAGGRARTAGECLLTLTSAAALSLNAAAIARAHVSRPAEPLPSTSRM